VLERNSAWLAAHGDTPLGDEEARRFEAAVERRTHGEPVAYIVGAAGFFGRTFAVTPAVLVPRPETEHVVELALAALRAQTSRAEPLSLCDVGTGSGALAVTLACELPGARVVAIDVSPEALAVAERNARVHGVAHRIRFVCSDLFDAAPPEAPFACIVANLPYVRSGDLAPAPDPTSFEPRLALDGGSDGLATYRRFLAVAPTFLATDGTLFMEAGPDTVPALAALAAEAFGAAARTYCDYSGRERIVRAGPPAKPTRRPAARGTPEARANTSLP